MPEITIEQLREIEWEAKNLDGDEMCPACRRYHNEINKEWDERGNKTEYPAGQHKDDCWLGNALKEVIRQTQV